jgi:hypothetical protein
MNYKKSKSDKKVKKMSNPTSDIRLMSTKTSARYKGMMSVRSGAWPSAEQKAEAKVDPVRADRQRKTIASYSGGGASGNTINDSNMFSNSFRSGSLNKKSQSKLKFGRKK